MSKYWRLEALGTLLFYIAAAVLVIVLPLHLLEHVPPKPPFDTFKQPPRGWALWLILIFAGFHAPWGLRNYLLEHTKSPAARHAITLLCLLLAAVIIGIGAYGLARIYKPW